MSTLVKVGDEDTILTSKKDSNGQKRETYISEEGKNDGDNDDVKDIKHERKGFVQDWNGDLFDFNLIWSRMTEICNLTAFGIDDSHQNQIEIFFSELKYGIFRLGSDYYLFEGAMMMLELFKELRYHYFIL